MEQIAKIFPTDIPKNDRFVSDKNNIPRLIDISEIEVDHTSSVEDVYADFKFSNRGEGAFGSTGTR